MTYISAAASVWAGWALAHPEFGSSVNPITTRGADYAHHITASQPGFENQSGISVYSISVHSTSLGFKIVGAEFYWNLPFS
jgi:hypothetical protein